MASPRVAQQNALLVEWLPSISWGPGSIDAGLSGGVTGVPSLGVPRFCLVDLTLARCRLRRPFDVAGEGARYLYIVVGLLRQGIPSSWLLFAASAIVWMGGLKND